MYRALCLPLSVLLWLFSATASAQATVPPDSGFPGSTCIPIVSGSAASIPAVEPGVSSTLLSDASPPAYYEWGMPSGDFEGKPSFGLFLIIHGGFWFQTGPQAVADERAGADFLRGRGWETLALDYRGCAQSLNDVLTFYDIARKRIGPDKPICVTGQSTGGQLALFLAAMRPDLNCAIAEAAPMDLVTIGSQAAYIDARRVPLIPLPPGLTGPQLIQNFATAAFGADRLAEVSPILHTNVYAHSGQRILIANGENDVLIPTDQLREIDSAVRILNPAAYFRAVSLAPPDDSGSVFFLHGLISGNARNSLFGELDALVAPYEKSSAASAAR
jgi:acetyl esterase/lipase